MSSRRSRLDRLSRRTVVGLVAAVGLTACGVGEAVPQGLASISPAGPSEVAAPTPTSSPTVEVVDVGELLDRIDAAVPDPAAYTLVGGGEFPDGALRVEGRVGAGGRRSDVTIETPDGTSRTIIVGDDAYLQDEELAASDSFLQVALDDPDDPLGPVVRDIGAQGSRGLDLSVLRCCATTAVRGPSTEIGGTPVDLFRVGVDPALAADEATDDLTRRAFEQEVGAGRFFYDLWLEADGLLRALAFSIDEVPVQFTFSDWGQPADIRPPRPRRVVEQPSARRGD